MSTYNELQLKTEILNFVRNKNIISTTNRGVTTVTGETHSGTGADVVITLTNSGMKNVREVRLGGVAVTYGSGWDLNFDTGKVTIYSSVLGTDNYAIDYDYGTGDLIYDDFPRVDLALSSYNNGRIGFDIISAVSNEQGIGGVTNNTNILIQFTLYARKKVTLGDMMYNIRKAFNDNKKNFYRFPFINIQSTNNLSKGDTGDDKTIQENFNVIIPFLFESN